MWKRRNQQDDNEVQQQSGNLAPSENYFDKGINWETSRVQDKEKSERRAWQVAKIAVGLSLVSWITMAMMMPLKRTEPLVLRVDNTTGLVDVVTALDVKNLEFEEAVDKYWMAQYVRARETYDWYTLQKDYNTVGMLSSPAVGSVYANLFQGKDALDKKFGSSVRATVEIISVVPNGRGVGTVRFVKTTKRVDEDGPGIVTRWVATIAYEYRNPSLILESQRLVNPLGFQVLSYRADPEMAGGAQ